MTKTEEPESPAVTAAKELLEKVGVLTIAARKVAIDGDESDEALLAMNDAVAAIVSEREREFAAEHLEHLAATVYTGQTTGALNNAAADLRAGAHIKLEPEAAEAE